MEFIIGFLVVAALIGIGLRISRKTGLKLWYIIVCLICWISAAFFIITSLDFSVITVLIALAFPIILIILIKAIARFFKWAFGGITGND